LLRKIIKITLYFGIFGDKSQFNTMKEALGSGISYINTVETELSADPLMVRSISELNKVSIISNSDCHSTNFHRLRREATTIKLNKLNYHNLVDLIKRNKIIKTYEFKPSAGNNKGCFLRKYKSIKLKFINFWYIFL